MIRAGARGVKEWASSQRMESGFRASPCFDAMKGLSWNVLSRGLQFMQRRKSAREANLKSTHRSPPAGAKYLSRVAIAFQFFSPASRGCALTCSYSRSTIVISRSPAIKPGLARNLLGKQTLPAAFLFLCLGAGILALAQGPAKVPAQNVAQSSGLKSEFVAPVHLG